MKLPNIGPLLRRAYFYLRILRGVFRIACYRLRHVHWTCFLAPRSVIAKDFVGGRFAYVGPNAIIGPKVMVGDYTLIGPNVSFVGDDHIFHKVGTPIIFSGRPGVRPTRIGRDAWIGAGSTIMAGTTVGDGAIVAAGCVVSSDIAPYSIHGGVPNRFIRWRFDDVDAAIHKNKLDRNEFEIDFCIGNR